MATGWREWSYRGSRRGALGRALLFVVLFFSLLWIQLWIAPGVARVDVASETSVAPGLLAQAAMMLFAALLAGWALLAFHQRPLAELGFGMDLRVPREAAAGLLMGGASVAMVVVLMVLVGAYRYGQDSGGIIEWMELSVASLLWLAIPAAAEEAAFRGYFFRMLVVAAGPIAATLLVSVVFAAAHGLNPNVAGLGLVNIFLAGVMLAVAVLRTGSLWFATALHLGWNWGMAGPLDLPVSGLDPFDAPMYEPVALGAAWLTGGRFGPEGGLAGTVAAGTLLAAILWTTRDGGWLAAPSTNRGGNG